jgi:hypothetical protein
MIFPFRGGVLLLLMYDIAASCITLNFPCQFEWQRQALRICHRRHTALSCSVSRVIDREPNVRRPIRAMASLLALLPLSFVSGGAPPTAELRFSAPEGRVLNEFFRRGPVAAHLVLTPGAAARLVVAFPAGNSGAALWFEPESTEFAWLPAVAIEAAERRLPDGSVLRGVTADLTASGGGISVRQAIVSSVRVIRDYEYTGAVPVEVRVDPAVTGRKVAWQRRRLDGAAGYHLSVEILNGAMSGGAGGPIAFAPGADGKLCLRVTALTGDAPLTPIAEDELLTAAAAPDATLRRMLAYLSYREKLLAGSWRFDTYFGRDTLMALHLLAPVLVPQVTETGLGAVLQRLNGEGEVAHEEDIGEYAVLRRVRAGLPPGDAPIFDYKMIDDDFMLAPVAAHYLLETPAGRARAAAFLASAAGAGETHGSALVRNLRFVVAATRPFTRDPHWRRLIALKSGEQAGNWRDSEVGLGGGRYPYDVNAVLAPAALDAIARLLASGLLQPYLDADGDGGLRRAAEMARVWLREAPPLFDVALESGRAREEVMAYARVVGVDPSPALAALDGDAVQFRAVSLDAAGRPVPVLNSDEAFALLFLDVAPDELERIATTLMRPFPGGLMTDVGLLVANPAYAPAALETAFDRNHYHGTVVWSWQQAMLAAGIERQLLRDGLPASVRDTLTEARSRLRDAIDEAAAMRGSELWSWSQDDGAYRVVAFGQGGEHETESNAAQLWSTVHLARTPD